MSRSICILDGHPDPAPDHFIHALCDAYAEGAATGGHTVERINIGAMDLPYLSGQAEFDTPPPEPVLTEREKIARADHIVIAFPLWLGAMPAKLKSFLELAASGGFFIQQSDHGWPAKMMEGKSARVIVTMGMPDFIYRFGMDAAATKGLERGVLGLSGFRPLHHSIIGGVGEMSPSKAESWFEFMREIGRDAV